MFNTSARKRAELERLEDIRTRLLMVSATVFYLDHEDYRNANHADYIPDHLRSEYEGIHRATLRIADDLNRLTGMLKKEPLRSDLNAKLPRMC
jgi:hypothetical protein